MLRKLLRGLIPALAAGLLVVQPLWAAAPARPEHFGLVCDNGQCALVLDLGDVPGLLGDSVRLAVPEGAVTQRGEDHAITLRGDVALALPTGTLTLADAELAVTLDATGRVAALRGSALAPVPTFAIFDDLALVTPARVTVGYDRGDVVALSHLALDPARRYLFVDAQAGLNLAVQGMALNTPAGQRATLVIDPAQAAIYVDGQVTLRTDGAIAFLGEMLPSAMEPAWLPNVLPLVYTTHLHGEMGRGLEPSLAVNSKLALDGGMAGRWLRLDAAPLTTEGWAMISPAGLLMAGEARLAVAPEQLLESAARAELFVPFAQPEQSEIEVAAAVTSPLLDVKQTAEAQVAGEPGWMARTAASTWAGLQASAVKSGEVIGTGYTWLETGTVNGWAAAQAQWCATTGWCAEDGPPQRVAEARE